MATAKVSSPVRFLIGLSAGFIAVSMPKLSGFLTASQEDITFTLFTSQFVIAIIAFSVIIGIAMVWLYMDSAETTKNLFMSALALPAVLSGGISMSSTSQDAEIQISRLSQENMALNNQLKEAFDIELDVSDSDNGNASNSVVPLFFGINNAYAEGDILKKDDKWQANTTFKTKSLNRNYYVFFGKSTNKQKLADKKKQLVQTKGLKNLALISKGKKLYLIQNTPRTRSSAMLAAIAFKKQKIKVGLVRLK